jgi:hypothetical protein
MRLDEHDIQRIAERVVELLAAREQTPPSAGAAGSVLVHQRAAPEPSGLVDAATLAQALGVDRGWVYAHAEQLGGIRLGGPQGRLRFDLAGIGDRFAPAGPVPPPAAGRSRPRRTVPGACTSPNPRSKIGSQANMAGRRSNAPGPTPGGLVPMHEQSTSRRAR